jgi:hypothetical protein
VADDITDASLSIRLGGGLGMVVFVSQSMFSNHRGDSFRDGSAPC